MKYYCTDSLTDPLPISLYHTFSHLFQKCHNLFYSKKLNLDPNFKQFKQTSKQLPIYPI